jgi:glyoxylase-like metal-dependent hydrolase (beta-lactamase superfamily II)
MGMKKKTVEIVPGVYMIGGPGVSSGDDCCVYLIESKDELCIIDTGAGKSA